MDLVDQCRKEEAARKNTEDIHIVQEEAGRVVALETDRAFAAQRGPYLVYVTGSTHIHDRYHDINDAMRAFLKMVRHGVWTSPDRAPGEGRLP